ncbi:HEPN domain-containing protein [Brachybacterium paraconglomeratum]|uniref:HEPN domain-containing protein n=1 Tax=Brachybacterium paraconglomeratum TaxID=173362 RepID=UPI002490198E|nr:HEPN domain-containing protein [Brachybacterium paraconglomeratum]
MNLANAERLLAIHQEVAGGGPGRKWDVDVLHRSAVVLLCASWEAYCEDVVAEVIAHFTDHAPPLELPPALRKEIAKEFSAEGKSMLMWTLAGDGWQDVLRSRLAVFKKERDRGLNSPRPAPIQALFRDHVGYEDITAHWKWRGTTVAEAKAALNEFVELRGSIAHRVQALRRLTKRDVDKHIRLVKHLVDETDRAMVSHAHTVTGVNLASNAD